MTNLIDKSIPIVYMIPIKMSGTGSIHDIESEHYRRQIKFPKNHKYAVVKAAYYNNNSYSTHESFEDAIDAYYDTNYSASIINTEGEELCP